jgi:tetratricopeptide (TPR) repeat protein
MTSARRGSWVVAGLLASLLLAGRAEGKGKGKVDEVRAYLDKATAAFALSRYAVAAENYEKAFELKPDPAVLYNAAQAHRLAGNKERALDLYQSYLRMYGTEKRAEIEKHVENLKEAIEKDRAVATSPPRTPAPVGGTSIDAPAPAPEPAPPKSEPAPPVATEASPPPAVPPSPAAAPPAPAAAEPAPLLVKQAAAPTDSDSVVKKPWFWIVIGGAVVAGAVSVFLLTRGDPTDPMASIGPPVPAN